MPAVLRINSINCSPTTTTITISITIILLISNRTSSNRHSDYSITISTTIQQGTAAISRPPWSKSHFCHHQSQRRLPSKCWRIRC